MKPGNSLNNFNAQVEQIARFLVGVMPIFVAFGLFFMVIYGQRVARYSEAWLAFSTLYSVSCTRCYSLC
jgi:hypothetical protein